jgi:hypothetical protein
LAQNKDQKLTDTVTVNAYEGAHGFGHVGVGVDSNKTEGLYPAHEETAKEKAKIVAGQDVPGTVHEDTAKKTDTVTIHVTAKQADAVRKYVSAAEPPNSGTYNLYGRNCARFVEGALKSADSGRADQALMAELVVNYYQETMKLSPEALKYLESRGLKSAETIVEFRLGLSNRTLGEILEDAALVCVLGGCY